MKYVRRVRVRLGAVVVVAALVSTACWGGAGRTDPPGPTVPTEAPATSTTAVPDVATVPAVIDEAYLNEVLRVLNRVDGDATRLIVANRELVPPAAARLRSIYLGEELNNQLRLWNEQIPDGFDEFLSPPGDRNMRVIEISSAGPACTFFVVETDFSAVVKRPPPPSKDFVALRPKDPGQDVDGYNRTAWAIAFEAVSVDGKDPADPCAG